MKSPGIDSHKPNNTDLLIVQEYKNKCSKFNLKQILWWDGHILQNWRTSYLKWELYFLPHMRINKKYSSTSVLNNYYEIKKSPKNTVAKDL